MSLANLVDEDIAVKTQPKAELERAPKFVKWVSGFESIGEKDRYEALEKNGAVFCEELFEYEKATADQNFYNEEENRRQTDRVLAIRATDKETRVRMEFQSENKAEVHCLLIENENQSRPAGEFKIRRCIPSFDTLVH